MKRVLALACALIAVGSASAQVLPRATPASVGVSAERLAEATTLLNQFVRDGKTAGAVAAVARHGKLVYLESVGVQDLASGVPMTQRSLFRIYSMTRAVTSVAVMMLYEQGKFQLDDPVAKYIPEFASVKVMLADGTTRAPTRGITVRDLILHTSGLSPRGAELYQREKVRAREYTMNQFIANLVRVPLMEDPGTRYRYSEGSSVLGRLVEVWSGQPFEVFLERHIFQPLRMPDTRFWADTAEQRARLTTVYTPAAGGGLAPIEIETVPFTQRPTLIEGAVGLLSSTADYVRFSQMLLNKGELDGVRVLKAASVESMTRNGLSDAVQSTRRGAYGWGLGNVNVLLHSDGKASVGEYGWDGTAGTIFWIDPVKETIIVLMTQNSPADPDKLRERFKAIIDQAIAN
jgi:CubicO group peptidase (beta-lactamase class C family)